MNYDARISKIEAQLLMNQKDIDRLHVALEELRRLFLEKFEQTSKEIQSLREHTDRKFQELSDRSDRKIQELSERSDHKVQELSNRSDHKIQELSDRCDQQFAELRREMNVNMRWMLGMWFATLGSIAGLAGRVFGLY